MGNEAEELIVTVEMRFTNRDDADQAQVRASEFTRGLISDRSIAPMLGCRVELDSSRPGDYTPLKAWPGTPSASPWPRAGSPSAAPP